MKFRNGRILFFAAALLTLVILPVQAQDTGWTPHMNQTYHIVLDLPDGVPLVGQTGYYQDADMILNIDAVATVYEADTLKDTCLNVARIRQGDGQIIPAATQDYCLIKPGTGNRWAAILTYPAPITLSLTTGDSDTFRYLLLISTEAYIRRIAESVTFPPVPPARLFVKSALELLQTFWYYRRDVDWQAVEDEALRKLNDEPNISKGYQALQAAIVNLRTLTGDQHLTLVSNDRASAQRRGAFNGIGVLLSADAEIFFIFPDSPAQAAGLQPLDRIIAVNGIPVAEFIAVKPGDTEETLTVERPGQTDPFDVVVQRGTYSAYVPSQSRRIGQVGYLETFGFDGSLFAIQQYAEETQAQIRETDQTGVCGWILDTRRNIGGRFAPMFTAVGPLLGDGDILHLVDTHGVAQIIRYEDGDLHEGPDVLEHMVDDPYTVKRDHPPVALLVSHNSASAGEMTPMLFLNRAGAVTRIFGEPTYGLTSAIHYYDLYDGGKLQITTHRAADRSGQTYPGGLVPDVPLTVNFDATVYGTDDDPVIQAALNWLNEQPGCAP